MKKIILLLFLVFLGKVESQAQGWEWKEPTSDSKILKDLDDNVYVFSNASTSFTIRKLNIYGTTLWTKTGTGNAAISAYKIDGNNDLIVLGNLTSTTTIDSYTLAPLGIQSFFILKITPTSTVLSANVYGSPDKTFANDLFITATGDYLIGGGFSGTFEINGDSIVGETLVNLFILKTDSNQNLLWSEKSTRINPCGDAYVNEVVETESGKIYTKISVNCGSAYFKGDTLIYPYGQIIVQLDNLRNISWKRWAGGYGAYYETTDMQTSGDTLYMKQYASAPHVTWNTIFKWDVSGLITSKSFSYSRLAYEIANGKIYYAYIGRDDPWMATFYFAKIGTISLGLSEYGHTVDSLVYTEGPYADIQCINANVLYISGQDGSSGAPFVGKFNRSMITSVTANNEKDQFQVFPNPSSGQFTLQVNESLQKQFQYSDMIFVFDQLGNCVLRQQLSNSSTQQIDISKMAKGIYFIEVESGKERINKKIILN